MQPQILIAAASSGSGKTTFTIGLLRALRDRGLNVSPFKCGPDYIDTQFHRMAVGRDSVNLDLWMASPEHVRQVYDRYGAQADVCVTEGVMGAFDGYSKMSGSSAELAALLGVPMILLVNARSAAYSVAPLIYGFKHFYPKAELAGVVFNQVSSSSHLAFLKAACDDVGVECLGCLPRDEGLQIPSRHLGLAMGAEREAEALAERAAALVEQHTDIERLLYICTRAREAVAPWQPFTDRKLRIAVACDEAFNFVYKVNMDRLAEMGEVVRFSPLADEELPTADFVYLPGGYPELFADRLQRNHRLMDAVRDYVERGGRVLAECGGMIWLSRSLVPDAGKAACRMVGVLPLDCTMENKRLHLGYRRTEYGGLELRGHEFHYSAMKDAAAWPSATTLCGARGTKVDTPLYRYKNVIAGYTHWYWGETDIFSLWNLPAVTT